MRTNTFHAKKVLVALFAILLPMLAKAQERVQIDGIWYNIITKGKIAEVTHNGNKNEACYSGDIVIPATVMHQGVECNVTSIGEYAFFYCSYDLTSVTLPEGITSIGEAAFHTCRDLASINFPSTITSIGMQAFQDCWSLTSITLPEGLIEMEYSFAGCKGLTSVVVPKGVKSMVGAFQDCTNLSSVVLPDGVENIIGAFSGCSSLASIDLPESVSDIHDAFDDCSSLTSITIPKKITMFGGDTFYGCDGLTNIVLHENITRVYSRAFNNCKNLSDVYCHAGQVIDAEETVFNGSYPEYMTLHVPDSLVESYKAVEPWSLFGKVVALGDPISNITLDQSTASLIEGETLVLNATVEPEGVDKNLIVWKSSDTKVAYVHNGKVTAVGAGTTTITAMANDGSGVSAQCEVTVTPASYVITFLVDGEQVLVQTLTRGSAITLPDVPTKEGYTFSGWGEVPETMPARDTTFNATFIINKYLVTFKIGDEVIASDSLEYKSAIVAPEAPEKEGYTFSGWGEVADAVPAHDLTYEGSYSVNAYVLTYVVDGEIVKSDSIAYGTAITLLKEPTKEGYTFSGWSEAPATMPAKDVTIEGTFTQLPSVYLTISQADNGYVKQHLVAGSVCTYTIEAAEGWKIHTVTFNGEDVTSQLTEEGTFTTPELQGDAVLNIAYEKIDDAIESTRAGAIKVQGHQGIISIAGATEGEAIGLYTTSGTLVATATAEGDTTHLTVPTGQVYIVKVADTVVKIGM